MAKILEKKVLLGGCGGEAAPDSEETSWKVVAIKTVWCDIGRWINKSMEY